MDIPASDSFSSPLRKGFLQKLTGRGWIYSGAWKKRYCVLDGSKFYFYEKEHCKGNEKTCGVLNLDYYDVCEENSAKDKKNPYVFVVGTSVRGFFDNRHQFSAETADELQSWIRAIQGAITDARENRRKPAGKKQRHLEEKSPDLSTSSQDGGGGSSTACLVNATKDRVRGPQGRRLPQRKSMMPTSRKEEVEDDDIRQRSISLSGPHRTNIIAEEDPTPPTSPSGGDGKWLSLSMEDMDREKKSGVDENQRSSSVFDLQKQEDTPSTNKGHKKGGLLGQHAALTRELEMRLKAGRTPAHLRPSSEEEEAKEEDGDNKRIERLSSRVEEAREAISSLEEKMDKMTKRMEIDDSRVGDVLLQVTVTLKEAERINEECKRALAAANKAKEEYQQLARECRETLATLNPPEEAQQQHGA